MARLKTTIKVFLLMVVTSQVFVLLLMKFPSPLAAQYTKSDSRPQTKVELPPNSHATTSATKAPERELVKPTEENQSGGEENTSVRWRGKLATVLITTECVPYQEWQVT